ncbi:unnamed protein product [Rotaria sp. Silwood1]|nr:unnamed protein product [Rotaria sp. Silwood1]
MDRIILRVIELINKQLLSSSRDPSGDFILINIRNGLNQLLESNFSKSDWIRLFCRQMNRLMANNTSISYELWMEWHDDILCITNGRNSKQLKSDSWERFLEKMEFESRLEQCERQFQADFGERKSFNELFTEHHGFFQNYLRKCLSLHSKIRVLGLLENLDDLLYKVYGITDLSLTTERRKCLEKKLEYIAIDLDCSEKVLQCYEISSPQINNSNHFLPSIKPIEIIERNQCEGIEGVLQSNRWLVILSDPGCGKTSLLRWLTRFFSEKTLHNNEEFVRIPILIRIREFAAWLNHPPPRTLIDYIGEHTWFSERYCEDHDKHILKKLIDHGHALILLDGLDEIANIEQRGQIVNLVRTFIDDYVRAPDFTSTFDPKMVRKHKYLSFPETIETPLPSQSRGNQIIVTSRIVGYQLYSLIGPFIKHYSLLALRTEEAKEFAKKWMRSVEENVIEILKNETIELDKHMIENLSKKRLHNIQSMFEMKSKLIVSNPLLLSLICTYIFQSSEQLDLKFRIQLYFHIVQASFRLWKFRKVNISKNILMDFFINLATYLHLHSPSGLIDEFDIQRLCYLTFQQHGLSNNRRELQKYTNQLISLLEHNITFVVERGLQVFAFQHLSIQEYFVAQSLVKTCSIEKIAERIVSFTVDSRFHEPLVLAVAWISFNLSFDAYNQFCHLLLTSTKDYSIPFGTILLFDTFNDLKILPSSSVLLQALNTLFDHPSKLIGSTCFFWSLSRLRDDIIIKWMQSSLKDYNSISKFCECLETKRNKKSERIHYVSKLPNVVYRQLWSLHNKSLSIEFDIDQVLRSVMVKDNITDQIFNVDFSSYLSSYDNDLLNIHPLILSVIIEVCGGVYYKIENGMLKIHFATKKMHRESTILAPIMDYFDNNKEPHSIKIQTLIDYYQNFLEASSPSDTSSVIIDTFIAFICLQGLSQTSIYRKYENYQALPLALERFKWSWYHLMISGLCMKLGTCTKFDISFIQSQLQTILNVFVSHSNPSNEQNQSFLLACQAALRKLRTFDMRRMFDFIDHSNNQVNQEKLLVLLTCLPESLQKLYCCTIISSTDKTDSLPLIVFLLECLKQLGNIIGDGPMFPCALTILKPLLIEHSLENYALALFRETYSDISWFIAKPQLCDRFFIEESFSWEALIDMECQRISEENDLQLFAASISLARIYQAQHRLDRYSYKEKRNSLPSVKSEKIYLAIMNIFNPILRIVVFSNLLDMNNPLIFVGEQRDELQDEMIGLMYSLIPDLPLLTLTFLFIRCNRARLVFPELFREMSTIIGRKLNEAAENRPNDEQEAAFLALRQLHNRDLANYLSEFARKINNLSDLLHFNSTTFYRYFRDTSVFQSCNMSLLSVMYLVELTFDIQNLPINIKKDPDQVCSSFITVFRQLWTQLPRSAKVMTSEIATLITNYLPTLKEPDISSVIKCISKCVSIDKRAIPVIKQWLKYQMDENLEDFAQYAALELIINGSDIPNLIDTVKTMFHTNNCFRVIFVADRLFNSPLVDSTIVRQILVELQQNVRYASKVSVWLNRKDTLKLLLNLEVQQLILNAHRQDRLSIRPFLLMINGCSKDLQIYLLRHLCAFMNKKLQIPNSIEEEYVAIVVKWIIERLIQDETRKHILVNLYQYIFTLLHNQRFPRIQKAIVNALDAIFAHVNQYKRKVFMQDNIKSDLERVICYWCEYPIEVLADCLLSYGNCLLRLELLRENSNVPNEIKEILTNICEQFFPETLSIRASFCLIFMEVLSKGHHLVLNWFKNKWDITSETTYQILLQQTLYRATNNFYGLDEIVEHFHIHPESVNTFVINLYDDISNKNNNEYIQDPVPNYLHIANFICKQHSKKFCDAVRNSFFGEKEFQTKLYIHSKNYPIDAVKSINIYSLFGIVTVEFLQMLESIGEYRLADFNDWLKNLKQISDRDAVEKLFDLLNQKRYHQMFDQFLFLLKSLIEANVISLVEVHQRLPLVNNVFYESSFEWRSHEEHIFDLLLDISCFENEKVSLCVDTTFTTKDDIDDEFDTQMAELDNKLNLPCKENFLGGFCFPKRYKITYS